MEPEAILQWIEHDPGAMMLALSGWLVARRVASWRGTWTLT